ncbi:hypothetical protein SAMN05428949_7177 [Chitinophaga sp. YR627]|uniref:hypothetical protein n=1 Tax=Chitinophaga sp. YR627 TaxID=1881041 RepID=UPI0008F41431|nr:hypothetical protein [Chitinophaga sp. YR627]SFP01439.1 hypothetical protein SAMN05428949_7177 [Chitinophaga sp. YR627]
MEYLTNQGQAASAENVSSYVLDAKNGFSWQLKEVTVKGNSYAVWNDARMDAYTQVASALDIFWAGGERTAEDSKRKKRAPAQLSEKKVAAKPAVAASEAAGPSVQTPGDRTRGNLNIDDIGFSTKRFLGWSGLS